MAKLELTDHQEAMLVQVLLVHRLDLQKLPKLPEVAGMLLEVDDVLAKLGHAVSENFKKAR